MNSVSGIVSGKHLVWKIMIMNCMFFLTVPLITSLNVQPLTPTSVMVSWDTSNSLVDNYTVSYTRLCDNVIWTLFIVNGTSNSTVIDSLYPGLQYSISITATNLLGKGMERTDSVTLKADGMCLNTRAILFYSEF